MPDRPYPATPDTPEDDPALDRGAAAARRLLEVMARLRGPQGCPWDREQDHRSLLPYLIEEAYELVEAVETGDDAALKEELGDVLLQVVFHAQVAAERGSFDFAGMAQGLADKLVQRHPHVFEDQQLDTADAVADAWHARKMQHRASALEGIPSALPALAWASKVATRAARSGFEWRHTGEIYDKAAEELEEIRQAAEEAERDPGRREALETEFGDLLFAQVQLARWLGIDPELALRRSVRKFIGRFRRMEELLRARGLHAEGRIPEQWEALWAEAKRDEA